VIRWTYGRSVRPHEKGKQNSPRNLGGFTQRGTNIIAIALDDAGEDCVYHSLLDIYPNVVSCSDPSRLPGQLCKLLTKLLTR
jgi:hypothetical protein